jgi:hypothetical protein
MEPGAAPSGIVAAALGLGEELERWAQEHRGATLEEHERAVLDLTRARLGRLLGVVLERALGLDQPAAGRLRSGCPGCGRRRTPHAWRRRELLTVCGAAAIRRPYYYCAPCRRGWVPADAALGVGPYQELSVGLRAWAAWLGALEPPRRAARVLEELAGVAVAPETVRQEATAAGLALADDGQRQAATVERTGEAAAAVEAPPGMLVVEADGVLVRYLDGWHEAKVGLVAGCRPGEPHRLEAPSYVAARGTPEQFGPLWLAEAARRGALEVLAWEGGIAGPNLALLPEVVVLGDGAPWIWTLAAEHFGRRTEIVDWYHAAEHLWAPGRALYGATGPHTATWVRRAQAVLWHRGAERLLPHLQRTRAAGAEAAEALRLARGYFRTNAQRMAYPTFRAQGLPVGSGAVESAAKHVVQQRLKRAGMRWGTAGGQALLALCAHVASDRPLLPVLKATAA